MKRVSKEHRVNNNPSRSYLKSIEKLLVAVQPVLIATWITLRETIQKTTRIATLMTSAIIQFRGVLKTILWAFLVMIGVPEFHFLSYKTNLTCLNFRMFLNAPFVLQTILKILKKVIMMLGKWIFYFLVYTEHYGFDDLLDLITLTDMEGKRKYCILISFPYRTTR